MCRLSRISAMSFISLFLALGSMSQAQNLLVNGSFEAGSFVNNGQNAMSLNVGSTAITGWTTTTAEIAWLESPNPYPGVSASDGNFSLDLLGYHDSVPYGGVEQAFATIPNKSYVLSFDLGGLSNSNASYSVLAIAGSGNQIFSYNPFFGGKDYGTFSLSFTATGATTTLDIVGVASGSGNYIGLDNVSVTVAPAPAPGAILTALLGAAPGATVLLRRRRNSSRN